MFKIDAQVRENTGKGAARKIRKQGHIPGVIYGIEKNPVAVQLDPRPLVKAMLSPTRRNTLIELNVAGGEKTNVLVKDIQIDPVRREALHVDFWAPKAGSEVVVSVPLVRTGRSKAVQLGAKLEVVRREIPVRVKADAIPVGIEVDVTDIGKGAFRAKQVTLPQGCELAMEGHITVLTVSTPRGQKAETTATEGEEAAATPAA